MTTGRSLKIPKTVPAGRSDDPVPLPDPPPLPDGMQQHRHLTRADQTLETWLRARRRNVLVGGEGYLCPDRSDVRRCPVPDLLVAFDVDPERVIATNGYVIDEVGKPPDFVLEVASETTGARDYTVKRRIYADMGVGEYWRFDPSGGKYHDKALAGDRLANGAYVPIPVTEEPDGEFWGYSPALELSLCWKEGELYFYDPVEKVYLPRQPELKDMYDAAQSQRNEAVAQRDGAVARADEAETRADDAEAQRDAALLEIERLREQLRRRENQG